MCDEEAVDDVEVLRCAPVQPCDDAVPDDELLEIYTALRPGRSTPAELEAWAARLDDLGALRTASFVREAAAVYVERRLVAE